MPRAGLDSPPCAYCRLIHADPALAWQVHADCEPLAAIRSVSWFVLPPALETHFRRLHADYQPPPPYRSDCRAGLGALGGSSLSFVSPREGAFVFVPRQLDGTTGRVVFEAAHRDPLARVFWHLDDEYQGERGRSVERRFTVVERTRAGSASLPGGPVVQLVRTAGS